MIAKSDALVFSYDKGGTIHKYILRYYTIDGVRPLLLFYTAVVVFIVPLLLLFVLLQICSYDKKLIIVIVRTTKIHLIDVIAVAAVGSIFKACPGSETVRHYPRR